MLHELRVCEALQEGNSAVHQEVFGLSAKGVLQKLERDLELSAQARGGWLRICQVAYTTPKGSELNYLVVVNERT